MATACQRIKIVDNFLNFELPNPLKIFRSSKFKNVKILPKSKNPAILARFFDFLILKNTLVTYYRAGCGINRNVCKRQIF